MTRKGEGKGQEEEGDRHRFVLAPLLSTLLEWTLALGFQYTM